MDNGDCTCGSEYAYDARRSRKTKKGSKRASKRTGKRAPKKRHTYARIRWDRRPSCMGMSKAKRSGAKKAPKKSGKAAKKSRKGR